MPGLTSVASGNNTPWHSTAKPQPSHKPDRRYDVEAETSIPKPPCARKCSLADKFFEQRAALFSSPVRKHFWTTFTKNVALAALSPNN
jgi:hypothetical protein